MEYKTFKFEMKGTSDEEYTIEGFASVYGIKDDQGDVIEPGAFTRTLDHKEGKVPLLWQHDPNQPIGIAMLSDVPGKGLWMKGELNKEVAKAREAYALAKQGAVKGLSIGYNTVKAENDNDGTRRIKEINLWEVSSVVFPANPQAQVMVVKSMETKGAIPYKKTPLASEDESWDAGKEVAQADVEDLKVMCAWYDEKNPDLKSSYKLPHHKADGYACVWRGVAAAMAALFGARGGVNIPDSDRKGVYNHLAKHYDDFGKQPPEFQFAQSIYEAKNEIERELKYGRILSSRSREKVEAALKALQELLDFVNSQEEALHDVEDSSDEEGKDADYDSLLRMLTDIRKEVLKEEK